MGAPKEQTRYYILFAGINGAGKSTLFQSRLWNANADLAHLPRVNSDEILVAMGGDWTNKRDQLTAGKEAVQRMREYLERGTSFNQETTLTGRSVVKRMRDARARGYRIIMYYVGVEDPEIANRRIAHRTTIGGHGIDPSLVRKRAVASFNNLIDVIPLCDEVFLFDNTHLLTLVARLAQGDLVHYACESPGVTWPDTLMRRLLERMDEKR